HQFLGDAAELLTSILARLSPKSDHNSSHLVTSRSYSHTEFTPRNDPPDSGLILVANTRGILTGCSPKASKLLGLEGLLNSFNDQPVSMTSLLTLDSANKFDHEFRNYVVSSNGPRDLGTFDFQLLDASHEQDRFL